MVLRNPDGGTALAFQSESEFVRPVWPAGPGDQQMMMHLEIHVDDLDDAVATPRAVGPPSRIISHRTMSVSASTQPGIRSAYGSDDGRAHPVSAAGREAVSPAHFVHSVRG